MRRARDQGDLAFLCATIMNASGRYKRTIRASDLLPAAAPSEAKLEPAPLSAEERQYQLENLKREFGIAENGE